MNDVAATGKASGLDAQPMSGIGHNGGPSMEPGHGFRKVAWTKARQSLLPSLPLEIVRVRVARAKRLGLPYRTYATIRASSGRDIVAFLFSGNALALTPARPSPPVKHCARLADLDGAAERLAAIYAPLRPADVIRATPGLDAAVTAPTILTPWGEAGARLRGFVRDRGLPPDGVVLITATALERDWCVSAGLAGMLDGEAFFARTE
ncbi:MAG: hypothetical protein HLUCCO18_05035 [Rhodobacteraceae bacterium HLUCCO18]|nr:MAG: hypothetical protein HLUCCO18_05035 [Rhodobacteraceae bacterium HLUCCO18]